MELKFYLAYFGVYAPIILFILAMILLRNKLTYLNFFIGGFILNNIVNIILKFIFKELRPLRDKKNLEIGIVNGVRIGHDKYGMPSAHAQNCSYCLTLIALILNNPFITLLFLLITIISMFQRYIYNNHTITQLLVGFIIGCGTGSLVYFVSNKYIVGNIKIKEDENGPL